jgi:hypothetical protein
VEIAILSRGVRSVPTNAEVVASHIRAIVRAAVHSTFLTFTFSSSRIFMGPNLKHSKKTLNVWKVRMAYHVLCSSLTFSSAAFNQAVAAGLTDASAVTTVTLAAASYFKRRLASVSGDDSKLVNKILLLFFVLKFVKVLHPRFLTDCVPFYTLV